MRISAGMMIVEIGNSSAIIPAPVTAVKGGRVRVTVISTVLNEGEAIRRLMDSLVAQTRQPDEVVIVDGGSRDNTVAVIQEYAGRLPLRVLVEPGPTSRAAATSPSPPRPATSSPPSTWASGWSRSGWTSW